MKLAFAFFALAGSMFCQQDNAVAESAKKRIESATISDGTTRRVIPVGPITATCSIPLGDATPKDPTVQFHIQKVTPSEKPLKGDVIEGPAPACTRSAVITRTVPVAPPQPPAVPEKTPRQ